MTPCIEEYQVPRVISTFCKQARHRNDLEPNYYLDLRQTAKNKVDSPLTPIVSNVVLGAEQEEHYERFLVLGSFFRRCCERSVVHDCQ